MLLALRKHLWLILYLFLGDGFHWNVKTGSRLRVGVGCLGFDLFWFGEREWKGLDLLETFPHGGFHCRSYYKILYSTIQSSFPWMSLWKSKVSMKVSFFLWIVALGRILTTNNLWKR